VGATVRTGLRGGVRVPAVDQEDRREHRHLRVGRARGGQRQPAAGAVPVQAQATQAQCEFISTLSCFSIDFKCLFDSSVATSTVRPFQDLLIL